MGRHVGLCQVIREAIAKHGGYEINTEGDSFHIAFKGVVEAVAFCMDVQYRLLETPWTRDVLRLPTCRSTPCPTLNPPQGNPLVYQQTTGSVQGIFLDLSRIRDSVDLERGCRKSFSLLTRCLEETARVGRSGRCGRQMG